jgi:hypothetical protein
MTYIQTTVARAILERASPILCRTPRRGFRRGSPPQSRPAAVAKLISLLAGTSESREGAERSPLVTCKRGLLTSVKYAGDDTQIHKSQVVRDKLLK